MFVLVVSGLLACLFGGLVDWFVGLLVGWLVGVAVAVALAIVVVVVVVVFVGAWLCECVFFGQPFARRFVFIIPGYVGERVAVNTTPQICH